MDVIIHGTTIKLQSVINNSSTLQCWLKAATVQTFTSVIHTLHNSATGIEHCSEGKQFVYMHSTISWLNIKIPCIKSVSYVTSHLSYKYPLHSLINKIFKLLPCKRGMEGTVKVREQKKNVSIQIKNRALIYRLAY